MKKLALSMMALLIITLMPSHIVSAAEASNTQAGASIIEANKTYTESISSGDDVDFTRLKLWGTQIIINLPM